MLTNYNASYFLSHEMFQFLFMKDFFKDTEIKI